MTTGSGQEQPITRDVLLDARLAQAKDTHRVQVRRIRIVPGHAAGLHVHKFGHFRRRWSPGRLDGL